MCFMVELKAVSADIELLHRIYAAFNRREFEALLAAMQANVDWPNGVETRRGSEGSARVRNSRRADSKYGDSVLIHF